MSAGEGVETRDDVRSFRPTGIGRYFTAGFLAVWLCGWIIGEVVALGVLLAIIVSLSGVLPDVPSWGTPMVESGGIAFALLFLVVWLTFWTVGGVGALTATMRALSGEDRLALTASGLVLVYRAGPFRKHYAFDRAAIRRVRLRPKDAAVVADTTSGTHALTSFGSRDERDALVEWLNRHLGLPGPSAINATGSVPTSWHVESDAAVTYLRKVTPRVRAIRSGIAWIVTGAVAVASMPYGDGDTTRHLPALALTLLLAIGAALSTWARREWIVRHGELTFRWTLAAWSSERTFHHARLDLTHNTDSDNDSRYELVVGDEQRRQTIHSQINDSAEAVDLGRWLAAQTGFPFSPSRP